MIEPNWSILQDKMKTVNTVDEVLMWHSEFLDRCLKHCLIGNPTLFKVCAVLCCVVLCCCSGALRTAAMC